jgi:hypothetical protein
MFDVYLAASHLVNIAPTPLIRIFYTVDPLHKVGGYKWLVFFPSP